MLDKNDFVFSTAELHEYVREMGFLPDQIDHHGLPIDHHFSLLIPKYYLDLIDWNDPKDPLALMVIPHENEHVIFPDEIYDPIGDKRFQPVPGIVHRYSDRCLLLLTQICPVHCRFCFRKEIMKETAGVLIPSLSYIASHPEIREVILSGGDPLMLTDHTIKVIMQKLEQFPHVKQIRFHTRTPAVYPKRITPALAKLLRSEKSVIVIIHINHPREITDTFKSHISLLQEQGILLLSQTVLLKGVNAESAILAELFTHLIELGIKPYYLHHLDKAMGTNHFRISLDEGLRLYKSLRGIISGVCIPEYVIDLPGGDGKIPATWFTNKGNGVYEADNFRGKTVTYHDPAWRQE